MKHLLKFGFATFLLGGIFAACGSGQQTASTLGGGGASPASGTGANATSGTASNGSGTGNSMSGSMGSNVGGAFVSSNGSGDPSGTGGGPTCGGTTSKAELIPLDIFLMLDSSGSMSEKTGASAMGPTKWSAITQALSAFFADPMSAGLGVGLQHFPLTAAGVPASCTTNTQCPGTSGPCLLKTCSGLGSIVACTKNSDCFAFGSLSCVNLGMCGNLYCAPPGGTCTNNNLPCTALTTSTCANPDSCVIADYAAPKVEIAPLNGAAGALNAAIASVMPAGATPTAPALQGAIDHAKTWAMANPTHTVIVLLATDGLPTECMPQTIPGIAQIAASGVSGSPSIKTFAIGVFSQADITGGAQANLNQIAAAGGSTSAFIVDASMGNVEQMFLAALNAIRGTKLACEYQVPPAGDAGMQDFGQVNVQYTPSGASMPTTIGYTGNLAGCDPVNGGWYYDVDPAQGTPTKIIMCPATCTKFGADTGGQVDIQVGCATIHAPPPN
jgi:hypothetical protein